MEERDFKGPYGGDLKKSDHLAMYRLLVLTREFELRVAQVYLKEDIVNTVRRMVG